MKDELKLIRVSRARILNIDFRNPATWTTPENTPTDAEKEWFKIFDSTADEFAILRRKISVCLDAEVSVLEMNKVVFTYGPDEICIESPTNSYNVSRALEISVHDGFAVLCAQNRVSVNKVPIKADKNTLGVDALSLSVRVANKFFFLSYV